MMIPCLIFHLIILLESFNYAVTQITSARIAPCRKQQKIIKFRQTPQKLAAETLRRMGESSPTRLASLRTSPP